MPEPAGRARPPLAILRQMVFNSLGERVIEARVLDIFAGSGSWGLEALSRGAASCVFLEQDRRCIQGLKEALQEFGLSDSAQVIQGRVPQSLARREFSDVGFGLIFADTPFDAFLRGDFADLEQRLVSLLAPDGLLLHRVPSQTSSMPPPQGLELVKLKAHGISALRFLAPIQQKPAD